MVPHVSAQQAAALLQTRDDVTIVDVREPWEWQTAHIDGAMHVPLSALAAQPDTLPQDRALMLLCHHGMRSLQAAMFLKNVGFEEVYNVHGGIDAWSREVDSSIPRY